MPPSATQSKQRVAPSRAPRAPRQWGLRHEPAPFPNRFSEQIGRGFTRLGLAWLLAAEHIDRHHIPQAGPVMLVSNHPTICDPFLVAFGTRRWVTWLAFDEALEWPIAGWVMRTYRAIPVNLAQPRPSSVKAAYGTLARGRVLGMFFEGERSFTYGLNRPLKTGAARMAIRAGVTIVPVTVAGARRAWPREQKLPRPGKVSVRYHPPIDAATFRPDLPHKERGRLLTEELAEIIGGALPDSGTRWFY